MSLLNDTFRTIAHYSVTVTAQGFERHKHSVCCVLTPASWHLQAVQLCQTALGARWKNCPVTAGLCLLQPAHPVNPHAPHPSWTVELHRPSSW